MDFLHSENNPHYHTITVHNIINIANCVISKG